MPRGRPKGTGGFDKERARRRLRELVWQHMDAMIEAQVGSASGLKYLVAREKKTGKFVPLTEDMAKAIVSGQDVEHEAIEVWEKQPSTPAFTDLMNRAIDKPAEQVTADVTANVVYRWKAEE